MHERKVSIAFFISSMEQIILWWIFDNSLMKKYYKNNFEFHKIIK